MPPTGHSTHGSLRQSRHSHGRPVHSLHASRVVPRGSYPATDVYMCHEFCQKVQSCVSQCVGSSREWRVYIYGRKLSRGRFLSRELSRR
eukprot:2509301-Prymnesium_polylepis.1